MTKSISPIIFRQNLFLNSTINKIHIKLYKTLNYLNYFKFFQLILNTIYMYKKTLKKIRINRKFLYFTCSYTDINNICLNICFYGLFGKKHKSSIIPSYMALYKFTSYLNYFLHHNLNVYNRNLFIWVLIPCVVNTGRNKFYIMNSLKYCILKNTNHYSKIISLCNKILTYKFKNRISIHGIKVKYSGCTHKGGEKKRTFAYSKGDVSICSVKENIEYINSSINTYKGTIGIKCWLVL
ncbi:Ribosomal protein S3 C-terminal domain family protein (apicoplast) [Babesia bovis T2Bo]|uniref:Rps3 n=1 Tax=Babesia bovis TaxID=5865 RepID=A7AXG9_BABBO|nr:Ribosomal protein S3 C-terminal domain family protein [Babesia bovis T2Bo]EDO05092.1 Ribosomal protein S3 C-terminal domain family protein [Babesia bovis T2Bo]|eukprot:YP_002290872.1 rps3 (apicoplast) [Babesia bovis T2Bo]